MAIPECVWQVGGGNGRNLVEYYKNKGVCCIGPGIRMDNVGWNELLKHTNSNKEASALWQFYNDVQPNDIILVKNGRKSISLIGIVKEMNGIKNYKYVEDFIDGWDLHHQIEMDWYDINDEESIVNEVLEKDYSFPVIRFSKCNNGLTEKFTNILQGDMLLKWIEKNIKNKRIRKVPKAPDKYQKLDCELPTQYCLSAKELRLMYTAVPNETFITQNPAEL